MINFGNILAKGFGEIGSLMIKNILKDDIELFTL